MEQQAADIIVIGGGIAGVSAAAELASHSKVLLLEQESQPGYHATGRSAAALDARYGSDAVQAMTASSQVFFRSPPNGFSELALIRPRNFLFIAREDQLSRIKAMRAEDPLLQVLSAEAACREVPLLSTDYVAGAVQDSRCGDLDVDAIFQAYLRLFRRHSGELVCSCKVNSLKFESGRWQLQCGEKQFHAPIVVNAAGPWADTIAELAGIGGLGITPMRRTAVLIDPPPDANIGNWPMVVDIDEQLYFKPDAGQLLVSPADETPSVACDASPEELDVAIAVDRFKKMTCMEVRRINHRWAGLRSFAPDRNFVLGFDPRATGFFWLAGQGGYGVQTAPAVANLATALITGTPLTSEFTTLSTLNDVLAPQRLLSQ